MKIWMTTVICFLAMMCSASSQLPPPPPVDGVWTNKADKALKATALGTDGIDLYFKGGKKIPLHELSVESRLKVYKDVHLRVKTKVAMPVFEKAPVGKKRIGTKIGGVAKPTWNEAYAERNRLASIERKKKAYQAELKKANDAVKLAASTWRALGQLSNQNHPKVILLREKIVLAGQDYNQQRYNQSTVNLLINQERLGMLR